MDFTTMYSTGSTIGMIVLAWLWHRKRKLAAFALEVKAAAADKKVTDDEFWKLFDAVDTLNTEDGIK